MNWITEFSTAVDCLKNLSITKKEILERLKKIDEEIRIKQNNFVNLNNEKVISSLEELYFSKAVLETILNK